MALSRSWLCIRRWSIRYLFPFLSSMEYDSKISSTRILRLRRSGVSNTPMALGLLGSYLFRSILDTPGSSTSFVANSAVFAPCSTRSRFHHQLTAIMRSCRHVCAGPNEWRQYGKMLGDGWPTFFCLALPVLLLLSSSTNAIDYITAHTNTNPMEQAAHQNLDARWKSTKLTYVIHYFLSN